MSLWNRLFRGGSRKGYERGIQLFNSGQFDQAVDVLEEVIANSKSKESPISKLGAFYAAEAHVKLGIAEFHRGNLQKARHHFEIALAENSHYPDLYYYLGVLRHQLGDIQAAIGYLEKATGLNPEYAEATCYLGIVLHDAGYFERKDVCFTKAIELVRKTANPLSRFLIENIESRSFDLPVLTELKALMLENSSFEMHVTEATRAFNQSDFTRSIDHFRQAVELKPGYADLRCKLGLAYLEKGEIESATDSLIAAVSINPDYTEALYYLGLAYFRRHEYTASRDCLERAVRLNPEYADIQCQYGIVLLSLGDLDSAREAFRSAIELSPDYAKAHYMLGLSLHALGDPEGARHELQQTLTLNPHIFGAEFDMGLQRMIGGDYEEAVHYLQRFLEKQPARADAWCLLGSAFLELDRFDDAAVQLEKSLSINGEYTEAKKKLALICYKRGDLGRAESLITEALELHQTYPDLHKIRGDILMRREQYADAEKAYRQSLLLNPSYTDAVIGLVLALRRNGSGAEADAVLEEYVDRNPDNLLARSYQAMNSVHIGDD